jgi:hypothetical protein
VLDLPAARPGRFLVVEDIRGSGVVLAAAATLPWRLTCGGHPYRVLDLASAVQSASQTGVSKRALAEAFGISLYKVDQALDQPAETAGAVMPSSAGRQGHGAQPALGHCEQPRPWHRGTRSRL